MENPLRIQASYPWFSLCPEFIFSSCSLARFVYRLRAKEDRQKKRKDLSEPGIRHRGKGMYEWRIWSELKSVLRGIIEEGNISIDVRFIDHAKWPTRRTCHFAGVILSSFLLTGGVIRRNKPTLRGEIIQERGTLSLSLSGD